MPDTVSREVRHEEAMLSAGHMRYTRKVTKAKTHGREHETDYGQHLIKVIVEPLSKAITEFIQASKKKPGRKALAAVVLQKIDPDVAAFMTAS